MIDVLHELNNWLLSFAESEWAIGILALASFTESIFFPVPPDPLLLGIALVQQPLALWLAVIVTISSVAGALVGYWLGKRIGRPILSRLFSTDMVLVAERWLGRYGAWATILAAFTPIPYKVFAITAGVLDLDRRTFIIASLIGRGARFLTIGGLILFFGEEIESFLADNFEVLTVFVGLLGIVLLVTWGVISRIRRSNTVS
jgi:undecaprenyl-diphosphatase